MAGAFAGLGLVIEHLAVEVVRTTAPRCEVPLTLTAVETVSASNRRECVAIDLSEYADPLDTRIVRIPYSVYYKPEQQREMLGKDAVRDLPLLFLIPLCNSGNSEEFLTARDPNRIRELARHGSAQIPDQPDGMSELIASYRESELARIHDWFYAEEHDPPEAWEQTYDRTAMEAFPPSARAILERPNDLLLKPACIRHIVRILLALGWHPRHIAGLIRSKYERDHGWGETWYHYDAATRADSYCRLFSGLILSGLDELADFACPPVSPLQAEREKPEDLEPFKQSLRRRIAHDRLAHRPFHRLFL